MLFVAEPSSVRWVCCGAFAGPTDSLSSGALNRLAAGVFTARTVELSASVEMTLLSALCRYERFLTAGVADELEGGE